MKALVSRQVTVLSLSTCRLPQLGFEKDSKSLAAEE